MPSVDLALNVSAFGQEAAVLIAHAIHKARQPRPEGICGDTRARQCFAFDKIRQFGCHFHPVKITHLCLL